MLKPQTLPSQSLLICSTTKCKNQGYPVKPAPCFHKILGDVCSRAYLPLATGVKFVALGALSISMRPRKTSNTTLVRSISKEDKEIMMSLEKQAHMLNKELALAAAAKDAEMDHQRSLDRDQWFQVFNTNQSGRISVVEIQNKLQQLPGCEGADPAWAHELLLKFDADGDGRLRPQEFDPQALRRSVWLMMERERRRVKCEKQTHSERMENLITSGVRVCACFAYLLPVLTHLDAPATGEGMLQTMWAADYPILAQSFVALKDLDAFLFQVWWARLVAFHALVFLSSWQKIPPLLRFNALQAAILHLLCYVPSAIGMLLVSLGFSGCYFSEGVVLFNFLMLCVIYAVSFNLLGLTPDAIPLVSSLARRGTAV